MNILKNTATILARKIGRAKLDSEPFNHFVVDNFLPPELAVLCLRNFPDVDDGMWEKQDDDVEKKYRSDYSSEFDFPNGLEQAVRLLNLSEMLNAMSEKLEIPKLIPDPYFTGGGLNMSLRGGMLDVHVDGNYHDATGLNRRVNAILFLNPMWEDHWGGDFGLYTESGELVKSIIPIMNRLVVFDSNDHSYHGTPNAIQCPYNEARRSLILYYYTVAPREGDKWEKPHSALWKSHNMKDKQYKVERQYK